MSGQDLGVRYPMTEGADKDVADESYSSPAGVLPRLRPAAWAGWLNAVQQGQRGALMPWSSVMLGLGVALYFGLPVEPGAGGYAVAMAIIVAGVTVALRWREVMGPLGLGVALVALGLMAAGWRAHQAAGPVMGVSLLRPDRGAGGGDRPLGLGRAAADAGRGKARRSGPGPHAAPRARFAPWRLAGGGAFTRGRW